MSDKRIANYSMKGTAMILDFFKRRRRRQIAWHEGHDEGLRAMRASVGRALGLEPNGVNNKGEGVWRYSSILDEIDRLREVERRAGERAYRAETRADALYACINSIAEAMGLDGGSPFVVAGEAIKRLGEMEEHGDQAYEADCRANALQAAINSIAEKLGFGGHVPIEVVEQAVRQTVDRLGELEDQAEAAGPAPTMPLTEDGERVVPGEAYSALWEPTNSIYLVRFYRWDASGRPIWMGSMDGSLCLFHSDHCSVYKSLKRAADAQTARGGGA